MVCQAAALYTASILVYNNFFSKKKIKSYCDKVTDFYDKETP